MSALLIAAVVWPLLTFALLGLGALVRRALEALSASRTERRYRR